MRGDGRFCPLCGTVNEPRFNFCIRCHQPLPPMAMAPSGDVTYPGAGPEQPPQDREHKGPAKVAYAVAYGLLAVIGTAILFVGGWALLFAAPFLLGLALVVLAIQTRGQSSAVRKSDPGREPRQAMAIGAALGAGAGVVDLLLGWYSLSSSCLGGTGLLGYCFYGGDILLIAGAGIVAVLGGFLGIVAIILSGSRTRRSDPRAGTTDVGVGALGGVLLLIPGFIVFLGSGGLIVGGPTIGALILLLGSLWLKHRTSAAASDDDLQKAMTGSPGGGWSEARTPEEMAMLTGQPSPGYYAPEPGGDAFYPRL